MKIIHLFLRTIRQFKMFQKAQKVYVACSGGPDSTALLYLLAKYTHAGHFSLGVIHVNHGLRAHASDQDEKWVKALAKTLKIPCVSGKANVLRAAKKDRLSIEEAARDLRYKFLLQAAKRHHIDTILLAHTADDQAETVLMRFLLGSGLRGFSASRPVFETEGVKFARPFIQISKKEIIGFLKKEKISYRTDQSNHETKFLRNRIRLELMPYLEKKFNPGIRKVLARFPEVVQSDTDFLEAEARKQFKRLCHSRESGNLKHGSPTHFRRRTSSSSRKVLRALNASVKDFGDDMRKFSISFPKKAFKRLHPAIEFRLLQSAVMKLTREEFAFVHWKTFQELFASREEFQVSFPGHVDCTVSKTKILIGKFAQKDKKKMSENYIVLPENKKVKLPGNETWIRSQLISRKPVSFKKKREDYVVIDRGQIEFPLKIRYREPGDLFQPLGQSKFSKLKDFLIRRKIPREKRNEIPLILSGNKIIWVCGIAVSDSVKATCETKKFLKLEVLS